MIDIKKATKAFNNYIKKNEDEDKAGFKLKINHTKKVVENSKMISEKLHLSKEDQELAELIALLHDIGRFEELKVFNQFESKKFNHAEYACKILFEDKHIKEFTEDESYYDVIKNAIINHNRFKIEEGLDEKSLLHAKIIRDSDKLDNFRVKIEEKITDIFPGIVKNDYEIENSKISDNVYKTVLDNKCVDIHDRKTPLDYWLCVLAFVFDLYFEETLEIVKEKDYINKMIDRIKYKDRKTQIRMNKIKEISNRYIINRIKEKK